MNCQAMCVLISSLVKRDPEGYRKSRDGSRSRLISANAKKSVLPEFEREACDETLELLAKANINNPGFKGTPRLVYEHEYVNNLGSTTLQAQTNLESVLVRTGCAPDPGAPATRTKIH